MTSGVVSVMIVFTIHFRLKIILNSMSSDTVGMALKITILILIYIIIHKPVCMSVCLFVCRCWNTTCCNPCSIVSGDISNCSYRLSLIRITRSHLSSPKQMCIGEKSTKTRPQKPSELLIANDPPKRILV